MLVKEGEGEMNEVVEDLQCDLFTQCGHLRASHHELCSRGVANRAQRPCLGCFLFFVFVFSNCKFPPSFSLVATKAKRDEAQLKQALPPHRQVY